MAAAASCLALLTGATPLASLDVEITGLRSARGLIQLCLTADAGTFPDCKPGGHGIKRTLSAAAPRISAAGRGKPERVL